MDDNDKKLGEGLRNLIMGEKVARLLWTIAILVSILVCGFMVFIELYN